MMSKEEVFDSIRDMLVDQLGLSEEEVTINASFAEDLGTDSLDLVELVMSMEEEFEIEIPDEDVEAIEKVSDAVEYVFGRIQ